jgi:glycosyltransferase involved in cell wall biosynthesis
MVAVLIPAFEPPPTLSALCARLTADPRVATVLVVDDGSSQQCQSILHAVAEQPRTHVVRHTRNQGKGAALKSGIRYVLDNLAGVTTVVTADADGQHLPEDILRVASTSLASPGSLVLGVRDVGDGAPARSRFGNALTRALYRGLVGQSIRDTQTGLRAFSRDLLAQIASVPGDAYEYELNVLISCRQSQVPVVQEPIASVYIDGNRQSHFRPVRDSWRVYSVLLGFTAVSLASAAVDNAIFVAGLAAGTWPVVAFVAGRAISMTLNYQLVRHFVFPQAPAHVSSIRRRYVTLIGLNVVVGQTMMLAVRVLFGSPVLVAKAIVETLLFLPNFLLQRDVVFRPPAVHAAATDWTAYYTSVPMSAVLTRRYSSRVIIRALRDAARDAGPLRRITELGGANSCFVDRVCATLRPDTYTVVDHNRFGLSLLAGWAPPPPASTTLEVREADVRSMPAGEPADVVFSVGLVEHFEPAVTRAVLRTHAAMARSGGTVLVSYPTPTALYRAARRLLEYLGLWSFPDERPLRFGEVAAAFDGVGTIVSRRTLWPLILTQELVVVRKS